MWTFPTETLVLVPEPGGTYRVDWVYQGNNAEKGTVQPLFHIDMFLNETN
jgi:hypothetical protein